MGGNPDLYLSQTSPCVMINIYSRVLPPMEHSAPACDFDRFSLISESSGIPGGPKRFGISF